MNKRIYFYKNVYQKLRPRVIIRLALGACKKQKKAHTVSGPKSGLLLQNLDKLFHFDISENNS